MGKDVFVSYIKLEYFIVFFLFNIKLIYERFKELEIFGDWNICVWRIKLENF